MTGGELRRAREAAGLSKRALARLSCITPEAVRHQKRKPLLVDKMGRKYCLPGLSGRRPSDQI